MDEYTKEIGWRYAEVGMTVELRNESYPTVVGVVEHTQISLLGDGGNTARVNGAKYAVAHGWMMYVKPASTLPPEPAPGTTYVAVDGGLPITRGIGHLHFRAGWDKGYGGKSWREVVRWHQEGIDDPEDDMVGPFVVEELMTKSMWERRYAHPGLRWKTFLDAPNSHGLKSANGWADGWNAAAHAIRGAIHE